MLLGAAYPGRSHVTDRGCNEVIFQIVDRAFRSAQRVGDRTICGRPEPFTRTAGRAVCLQENAATSDAVRYRRCHRRTGGPGPLPGRRQAQPHQLLGRLDLVEGAGRPVAGVLRSGLVRHGRPWRVGCRRLPLLRRRLRQPAGQHGEEPHRRQRRQRPVGRHHRCRRHPGRFHRHHLPRGRRSGDRAAGAGPAHVALAVHPRLPVSGCGDRRHSGQQAGLHRPGVGGAGPRARLGRRAGRPVPGPPDRPDRQCRCHGPVRVSVGPGGQRLHRRRPGGLRRPGQQRRAQDPERGRRSRQVGARHRVAAHQPSGHLLRRRRPCGASGRLRAGPEPRLQRGASARLAQRRPAGRRCGGLQRVVRHGGPGRPPGRVHPGHLFRHPAVLRSGHVRRVRGLWRCRSHAAGQGLRGQRPDP